jgi:cation diffusion facilitator family transporter
MTTQKISPQAQARQKAIRDITVYGMIMDAILSAIKISTGFITMSTALVADGLHSLSDMVTDIFVLIVNRYAHNDPDDDHPYGHARYETVGTLILGLSLITVGLFMANNYLMQLINNTITTHASTWALAIAALSIAGKEWQYRFTLKVAKKVRSTLLEANAWHSRSDAFSSVVVLFGIAATLYGYPQVEVIAALFVAYLIARMGTKMAWGALEELMDKGLEKGQQDALLDALVRIPSIINVHQLRTRRMSNHILLDAHVQVAPDISVSEGHQINEFAMSKLRKIEPDLKDITLHIDHEEDDDFNEGGPLAPLRPEIEAYLARYVHLNRYHEMTVHYDQQTVQLVLLFEATPDAACYEDCNAAIAGATWLTKISLIQPIASFSDNAEDDQ